MPGVGEEGREPQGGEGGGRGRRQEEHHLGEVEGAQCHLWGGLVPGWALPGQGWGGTGRRRQSTTCWSSSLVKPVGEELTDQHPGRSTKGRNRLEIKHS